MREGWGGEGKVGLVVDLVNRTVKNTCDIELTLKELIEKITTMAPGDTVQLDEGTTAIEI